MTTTSAGYYRETDCSVTDFAARIEQSRQSATAPTFAYRVKKKIPLYDGAALQNICAEEAGKRALMAEWNHTFHHGAGVMVLQNSYEDTAVVDKATAAFQDIINKEQEHSAGDHFAASGSNVRVWNAHEKLCMHNPKVFALYYANQYIDAISQSWLGPNYQMTAQVNQVPPGGAVQAPHRDYHLGFQSVAQAESFPSGVHFVSQYLTLQGAVAHHDMPLETGPTMLLPFSQTYLPGYVAWRKKEFREYFQQHAVQLPLQKGDLVFFNPALFHAAGANTSTDRLRMANLLQVSSAFAYPMEQLNRIAMCKRLYSVMQQLYATHNHEYLDYSIRSCASGYPFPTSLDTDPPLHDLAPQTQADLFRQALAEQWTEERFYCELDAQATRKLG